MSRFGESSSGEIELYFSVKLNKLIYTLFINLVIYVFIKLSYRITLNLFFPRSKLDIYNSNFVALRPEKITRPMDS